MSISCKAVNGRLQIDLSGTNHVRAELEQLANGIEGVPIQPAEVDRVHGILQHTFSALLREPSTMTKYILANAQLLLGWLYHRKGEFSRRASWGSNDAGDQVANELHAAGATDVVYTTKKGMTAYFRLGGMTYQVSSWEELDASIAEGQRAAIAAREEEFKPFDVPLHAGEEVLLKPAGIPVRILEQRVGGLLCRWEAGEAIVSAEHLERVKPPLTPFEALREAAQAVVDTDARHCGRPGVAEAVRHLQSTLQSLDQTTPNESTP